MDIGPPKYKEGDYVRIRFGSGHCKAMINKVKRNKGWDKCLKKTVLVTAIGLNKILMVGTTK